MNNYTSPFIHNSISQNNEKYPTILMKNLGLDPSIFNNMQKDSGTPPFIVLALLSFAETTVLQIEGL